MGTQPPTQKGRSATQFSAHVYCGQTAAWIKVQLGIGTEVGLGLRDTVFAMDPATPRKKGTPTPSQFLAHVYCGQMAGRMKPPLGTEVDHIRPHCTRRGPSSCERGTAPPPLFGPCLLWPLSPISGTAELLLCSCSPAQVAL